MEELIYLSRGLCTNSRHLGQIGQACPLDRFHRAKMPKQSPLAGGTDPRNFLQSRFANVFLATRAVRADRKTMRLVAQPFDEIKQGIAWRQLEGLATCREESLATRIPVRAFCNCHDRNVDYA